MIVFIVDVFLFWVLVFIIVSFCHLWDRMEHSKGLIYWPQSGNVKCKRLKYRIAFFHTLVNRTNKTYNNMSSSDVVSLEFFLNGAELSLNSVNSEKLINHWSMNWAQFKDPISHMCLAGAVVAAWSLTQEAAGWQSGLCHAINEKAVMWLCYVIYCSFLWINFD